MKTMTVVMAVVLSGCFGGYGYQPAPVAASSLPMVGPMGLAGGMGGYMIPPPPPPDLMFTSGHGYPEEWRGPHRARVINNTDYHIRVRMDGVDLQMLGMPPFVLPHQEAQFYMPLDRTDLRTGCEHHQMEYESYLFPNLDRPVQRTAREEIFCAGWEDGQVIRLGGF